MTRLAKFFLLAVLCGCLVASAIGANLIAKHDPDTGTIEVFREGQSEPILTQVAKGDHRPYLHPIVAPDGKGYVTEYSPGHHKHQTGIYWGFTRVNSRDYFHHPADGYWKRVSARVIQAEGQDVSWETVYDLLDENGESILTETQTWNIHDDEGQFDLDLVWKGEAKIDVTIGKYDYGGLFVRMPWTPGIKGEAVNAARQHNARAEGQRAMWLDVGMQVEGRDDLVHVAIFDHSDNKGFPQHWRVDGQLGVGPIRAREADWKIAKGDTETIKHRLVIYTGELSGLDLTEQWKRYSNQGGTYALWGIAQREGREAEFLTPKRAVEEITVAEGFKVNAYAREPMITQPMAFCWDDRGRMWIAENRDYESRGDGFANSGDSRILILEDTDRDGVADSRKVFAEGIPFPAGIAVGFGGLWLGTPPNLLFIPDRDGDDVADMDDIEVRLTGWGIRDRHETLNSFHWGPDGWLYGCQGYATPSRVRKPNGKGKLYKHKDEFPNVFEEDGVDINGGIWRYHPTKDRFEVVAHGFSNPWGIDYDAKGQLFITACVIPHLWHVIPGGIYHRQGGRHFNPYVYSDIRTIADHRHRSAHGGARIYLSDAYPERYHGQIFMANIHEHAVLVDKLVPKGSGFVGQDGEDFLLANNAQWIGFSMEIGPEGGVYVLDWHDADICGKDVLNKETGRVFRIVPKNSAARPWAGRYGDLAKLDDAHLVGLQRSKSAWHARRARVILQHRAVEGKLGEETHERLKRIYKEDANADWRLRAMWALHVTRGFNSDQLLKALHDRDAHIRAWAIQLLCEDGSPSPDALTQFVSMATIDPSPVVRLYLACALQRIPMESRARLARALVNHAKDANDHNIPKMIWFGIESLVAERPRSGNAIARSSKMPLVTRHIGRRLADANELEYLAECIGNALDRGAGLHLLHGMRDGLEGRNDVSAPNGWEPVYAKLQSHPNQEMKQLALGLAQQFGDTSAAKQLLETLTDADAPLDARLEALRGLAAQKRPELAEAIPNLLEESDLSIEAIRAVAAYEADHLGELLLERYAGFDPAHKLEVVHTLASRPNHGWELTKAIKSGKIPKRDVPAYVARQLRRVVGNGFVEVWGPIDQLADDKKAAYAKYEKLLTQDALADANVHQGRAIYERTCTACHKLYGEGGEIGPDITGSNRANLDYILSNILDPSGVIQDDYKMVMITTRDGRTYAGNVANESERQVTLRVVGQDPAVIAKSAIQSRETVPVSMMPEGLLATLTDAEVIDLIAYLKTPEQVALPEAN